MKYTAFLCLLTVLVLFFSCSSNINGSLAADGSASVSLDMSLGNRITLLIRSMAVAGGQSDGQILDSAAINSSMSHAPGISAIALRNTSPFALAGTVRISNINDFLAQAGSNDFIIFEQGNAGGRCVVNINRNNGGRIITLLSPEIGNYLNALMAPVVTGEQMTKTEYLELMELFYNKAISDEIAASRIRASIEFPNTITNVTGGTFSGRTASFDIALLDLMVLETPVNLEVRWR